MSARAEVQLLFLSNRMLLKRLQLFVFEQIRTFGMTGRTLVNIKKSYCSFKPQIKFLTIYSSIQNNQFNYVKLFHTSYGKNAKNKKDLAIDYDDEKSLLYYPEFERWENKNKKTFLETVAVYKHNVKNRAAHVDFIKAALKNMKAYGVHKDLECYKKLIDILPKGVYVCTNKFLVDGMYFPRQQYAAADLLDQMNINGVAPDIELGIILKNIFGSEAFPCRKYRKLFYWMVMKWQNRSPFSIPKPLPSDSFLLAKLAIERITCVDLQTKVSVFQTNEVEESIDKTWIVSGQSPKQQNLLQKHPQKVPVIVEGGDMIWLLDKSINYFVLKADGEPIPFVPPEDTSDISNLKSKFFNPNYMIKERKNYTVHEQDDGIIYAVCATGTSSRDSLLSWVRILQKTGNPILADVPVLFRFKQKETLPAPISEEIVSL